MMPHAQPPARGPGRSSSPPPRLATARADTNWWLRTVRSLTKPDGLTVEREKPMTPHPKTPMHAPILPRRRAAFARLPVHALTLAVAILFCACAHLQPGADPLVVRVEQTETTAKGTFDAVLGVDHADRGFWRTNAPAFHGFCEWLRTSQPINARGDTLPRASAMLYSLDTIKTDYRASRASSNALYSAFVALTSTLNQAGSWLTIVTNAPAH